MSLPEPVKREHLHTRAITYQGFERADGLWDIEAHMTDVKTYSFENDWRGTVEAGEPLHEMLLRVTIDDQFVVQDVEAATEHSPFQMCPEITPAYKALVGITMGPGWRKAIRQRVSGREGCTHLTELLFPMATVAFQTIWPRRAHRARQSDSNTGNSNRRPQVLDTCHAWANDSPVVKKNAPKFYTGD